MQPNRQFLELTFHDSLINGFEMPPNKRIQGGEEADIEQNKIRLYVGDKPIAYNLKKVFDKLGKEVPKEIEIFKSYNAYLLTHNIGIIKEGGWDKVKQVGYTVTFPERPVVLVQDIMPHARFITTIGGELTFTASLNLNGELSLPEELSQYLQQNVEYFGVGGKFEASNNAAIAGKFSFEVMTPVIQAIGKGKTHSEWLFEKDKQPLYGRDIEMFQVILIDRFATNISFKVKLSCIISPWLGTNVSRESKWIDLGCKLDL